jgi:hypothetical protein
MLRDALQELILRTEKWRAALRVQAAQQGSTPPQLPDRQSMDRLLRDIERMLCVLLCMQPPEEERRPPPPKGELEQARAEAARAAAAAREEAARYQGIIAGLQRQLSEGQTRTLGLEATVEQLRAEQAAAGARPSSPTRPPQA